MNSYTTTGGRREGDAKKADFSSLLCFFDELCWRFDGRSTILSFAGQLSTE
jgi:hypothetical protein